MQLIAENEARILAAQNLASERSTNSSSSGSLGVSFGTDGLLFNASASKGKGQANGDDTSYTNTQIKAGEQVSLTTGGDATLQGAVIRAEQVKANIGGNLTIQSLQDTSIYTSKQESLGGSISVGYGKMSGSISASKSNIDSNFQSVAEQSGIKAGSGGFQVSVAGNTALLGSVIASDNQAVNAQKNSFKTGGTLSISDIQNTASYKGESIGISFGGGATADTKGISGLGIGIGSDKADASSTSSAGISGIAGNTAVRSTDAETGLKPIFDAARVQAEINAQVQITQAFGRDASKAVGSYANEKLQEAINSGDMAAIDNWKEGGPARVALHTLIGGLTGNLEGAAGAASSQILVPMLGDKIANLDIPVALKQALVQLAGIAIGGGLGGLTGIAAAQNATINNYLTSTDLRSKDQKIKNCQARGDTTCEVNVLTEYDLKSAKNSGTIRYGSVLSEMELKAIKAQLELLLQDSSISLATKADARKSIGELDVAINVIQRSPALRDAAELGLIAADVATLGELAVARGLTAAVVKQFAAKMGTQITDDAATRIAINFYKDAGVDLGPAMYLLISIAA